MGTLVGHVAPGFGFLFLGLWHLFNHIKLHSLHPTTYTAPSWFPSPLLRHLELLLIIAGSTASIAMELFIGPANHQPLDPSDLTIPSDHLHNFEHASISLSFLLFALFALLLDRARSPLRHPLTHLLSAAAFAQQLLMFHLHSADHMGVEGQYHWLLQLVIAVSLATTLMSAGMPKSFLVGFVRSVSISMQGVWFVVMGYALWTPGLVPKGCFMNREDGHTVVRCHDEGSLHRAKSLANIEFSWVLVGVVGFSMVVYLVLVKRYSCEEEEEYLPLTKKGSDEEEEELSTEEDLEFGEKKRFVEMGRGMKALDLER